MKLILEARATNPDKLEKAVDYFYSIYKREGNKGLQKVFPQSYGSGKTIDVEGVGRVNKEDFFSYLYDPNTRSDLVMDFLMDVAQENVDYTIDEISKSREFFGMNSNPTFLNPILFYGKMKDIPYLDSFREALTNFWVDSLDELIQQDPVLQQIATYVELKDAFYIIGDNFGWDAIPDEFLGYHSGGTSSVSNFIKFIQHYSNLKFKYLSQSDILKASEKNYKTLRKEFEDFFIEQLDYRKENGQFDRDITREIQDLARSNKITLDLINQKFSEFAKKYK